MLKLEARPEASKLMSVLSPVLALAITVVIGTALFLLLGKSPHRNRAHPPVLYLMNVNLAAGAGPDLKESR